MKWFVIDDLKKEYGCLCLDDLAKDDKDRLRLANEYNNRGWGVYWSVNLKDDGVFGGKTERKSDLVVDADIRSWFVDIDNSNKEQVLGFVLKNSPVLPSTIVESRGGYHIYFKSSSASVDNFREIQTRLIEFYNGDVKCKDIVRLLRVPNFYNYKDGLDKGFKVSVIWKCDEKYSDEDMLNYFRGKEVKKEEVKKNPVWNDNKSNFNIDVFQLLKEHDTVSLLEQISGCSFVGGSKFSFKDNRNGKYNFYINDKDHGFFINESGDIITQKGFSGSLYNFLKWYNDDKKERINFLNNLLTKAY